MLKSPYSNRKKSKNPREMYIEKVGRGQGLTLYNDKKRKSLTHLKSMDDGEIAYRSTSKYLRSVTAESEPDEPEDLQLIKSIPRTLSANELTEKAPKPTIGNPKLKSVEDYYDQIFELRKKMKALEVENTTLKTRNRRLEEDNKRKRDEIDLLNDPNKDKDFVRILGSESSSERNNTANVVMSLKKKNFRQECLLKERENQIKQMEANPRWTRSGELQTANRALKNEIERLKTEKTLRHDNIDYGQSFDEMKKILVQKYEAERKKLEGENEKLRETISQLKANVQEDSDTEDKNEGLEKKLTEVRNHNEELAKKLTEARNQNEELRVNFDELKRKRKEDQNRIENLEQENEKLKEKLKNLTNRIELLEREKNQMKQEKEDLRIKTSEQQENQRSQSQDFKDRIEILNKEKTRLEQENQKLENELKKLRREKELNARPESPKTVGLRSSSPLSDDSSDSRSMIQRAIKGHTNRQKFIRDRNKPTNSRPSSPEIMLSAKNSTNPKVIANKSSTDDDSRSISRLTRDRTTLKTSPPQTKPDAISNLSKSYSDDDNDAVQYGQP